MAKSEYGEGDYVVYPTHGVGRVLGIETQDMGDIALDLIVIKFEKDRMTLRVPVEKAANSGLRKLSSRKMMDTALTTLKGRSRAKRTMWSRRAQEYEAKINSRSEEHTSELQSLMRIAYAVFRLEKKNKLVHAHNSCSTRIPVYNL